MADAKQNKNKSAAAESSSEGFGFKQSHLGFDKNEVNLYINKLKKQMKEQQIEFDTRIKTLEINLQNAQKETNDARNAQRAARPGIKAEFCPYCGNRVEGTFEFCPFCGEKLFL